MQITRRWNFDAGDEFASMRMTLRSISLTELAKSVELSQSATDEFVEKFGFDPSESEQQAKRMDTMQRMMWSNISVWSTVFTCARASTVMVLPWGEDEESGWVESSELGVSYFEDIEQIPAAFLFDLYEAARNVNPGLWGDSNRRMMVDPPEVRVNGNGTDAVVTNEEKKINVN